MNLQISERTALVTASTGGIGMEIAASLAREGASVIVNGRSGSSVERTIEALRESIPNAKLLALAADLSTAEGAAMAFAEFPTVDILVNNLGIYEVADFFECSDERWNHLFEVNVVSGVRLCRHYLRRMLDANWGRVIFVSSESALHPAPEMAHYSATKLTQLSISRSLAELTKGSRVTVNSILPGSTLTGGVEKFIADVYPGLSSAEAEKKFMRENRASSLIQRLIKPVEVADSVAFLCGESAAAINGATLRVDGGIVPTVI